MDWHPILAVIGGIIQFVSVVPYVRGMLYGATRPNIVSWSLWTILQAIAVAAQLSAGFSWSIILLIAMTFNTALVVFLAAFGYGYKRYGFLDWTCSAIGAAAIVLWASTGEPVVALVLSVAADFIVAIPTILKAIRDPHSENALAWFLVALASLITLCSITSFTTANLLYPAYLFVTAGFVTAVTFLGQRLRPTKTTP